MADTAKSKDVERYGASAAEKKKSPLKGTETATVGVLQKKVFLSVHRKAPVSESLSIQVCNFIKKETPTQMLSCELCVIL